MLRRSLLLSLLGCTAPALGCEEGVVLSERLQVDNPADFYLVEIQRAHGDNLVGTVLRSFGGVLAPGRTLSIQFTQSGIADSDCAVEFSAGQRYLLKGRLSGGALQVSRYNSHNIPEQHERFASYLRDIEAATATE